MVKAISGVAAAAICIAVLGGLAAAAQNYGFVVDVTLSPKAAALLQAKKEGIKVSAEYMGDPVAGKEAKAGDGGEIELGNEIVTIPGASGRAIITGKTVNASRISWVKEFDVNINVFTARLSSPDNLIDCDFFQDAVSKAQAKPLAISCKLIGEK
jgi:hypothetical protein